MNENSRNGTGTTVRRILLAVYVVAIAILLFLYMRHLPVNRTLKVKLTELSVEKENLTEQKTKTEKASKKLAKMIQRREMAMMKMNRAIRLTPFEDLDFDHSPFFVASHRPSIDRMGMEVIVNVPPGDQRLIVAFPSQSDLQQEPVLREGHWNTSSLHFQSSEEVILESGDCYKIRYGLIKEQESTFVSATIRTKEKSIYSKRFQYARTSKKVYIYGAGTRNTVCRPGEVLKPFTLTMNGAERPKGWEWALYEQESRSPRKSFAHNLQFAYENEPTAFISPTNIVRFEQTRRAYKWKPLAISDVLEIDESENKFILKTFPKSSGRSDQPLY